MAVNTRGYGLAHPVYLDVPMMLSFLAYLEGGFAVSETEKTTASGARERFLKARGGLRAKLWAIGEANVEGEGSTKNTDQTQTESSTERHHTEASLFNLLYEYLVADEEVIQLEESNQLEGLYTGQLVELSGEYLGNPIEDVLSFFNAVLPYVAGEDGTAAQDKGVSGRQAQRSGNPAKRAAGAQTAASKDKDNSETIYLLKRMSQDIDNSPVHDVLFRTESGLQAVVTASSLYYSTTTAEYLRAGQFRVFGKVTKVVAAGDSINLTRRTVVGAAGPDMAKGMVASVSEQEDLHLSIANPIVPGPTVQVLPMAIFI
ncbi:hypothetical protein ARGLB_113_00390 [Arthrobacter globiformis NBRC 12137]|uniref:Uncharacterized protein n=1 Tax=Arthrobacter globiformis (strain ATCC 8010 / DSM 20124 / JCM 1332 / NBRC 12137 / NCIMB 8907 / NRRL B-2979 / 168) TaxID=1077972 RepID=H0QTN2_ARTG1|nr:hypothetical protein [Arthrobacter globiformis]GAB16183.1 hypothetical protein ARGLB_113_00390 [Arthrobacter globiformis NBRC 12137]